MSWRISTVHTSRYLYESPVVASYNEVRLTPRSTEGQLVLESSVHIEPAVNVFTYVDYFSTAVMSFDLTRPHTELVVVGSSVVETPTRSGEPPGQLEWADLADARLKDGFAEYLSATPTTSGGGAILADAPGLDRLARPDDAVRWACAWIRQSLQYEQGATAVSTSALEAWQARHGVCQDFAHIAIALLRELGIPTRYVSGYLHPSSSDDIGTPLNGAGHAWIECWLGEWWPVDPTHDIVVGDRHVMVATGRDYHDVAPFRGVYQGGRLLRLEVTVELTRLA